jgi:catechol-2,3-dioxygenase
MKRVVGIGGVFFKSKEPKKLQAWYQKHLGLEPDAYGGIIFHCPAAEEERQTAQTVWSLFPSDTTHFDPSSAPFMINYRVADLAGLLEQLKSEGVEVERTEDHEYGKFGWIMDPEGNRIELWEPASSV